MGNGKSKPKRHRGGGGKGRQRHTAQDEIVFSEFTASPEVSHKTSNDWGTTTWVAMGAYG